MKRGVLRRAGRAAMASMLLASVAHGSTLFAAMPAGTAPAAPTSSEATPSAPAPSGPTQSDDSKWPTLADAIGMVRVQRVAAADGRVVAWSPGGRRFAFVTWQGDLTQNANVYKLIVADLSETSTRATLRTVLTRSFIGDAEDPDASPFERLAFVDERTIAWLGRPYGEPQQVFVANIETGLVRQLTRSPTAIREFIADMDGVRFFSAAAPAVEDAASVSRLMDDGVFLWNASFFLPAKSFRARAVLDFQSRAKRHYFTAGLDGPRLVYDSLQNRLAEVGTFVHLNWRWAPATDGRVIVGVAEGLQTPPELVAIDLVTKQPSVLTDLNPQLRLRRHATVESFRWSHRYDSAASGLLIKPAGFAGPKRYPLVVLLDDGNLKRIQEPYLLDAFVQYNGYAIQPLAAAGFMVLYTREPLGALQANECERMREHVESAIGKLESRGLIDAGRVGLSGWSRAAYHTECVLMNAGIRIAAATTIDGGSLEYKPRFRPYTDEQLLRIRTPLLLEPHGLSSLMTHTSMADRLEALDRPTEVLYFHEAPHSTMRPQHRLRSLQTHLDWWRFWLQDEEDPGSEKAERYRQWRRMREGWAAVQ